tara:strand:+ start:6687 stop:7433 length:747 start_codon:yes stop_codon:yes gene_type:complete
MPQLKAGVASSGAYFNIDGIDYARGNYEVDYRDIQTVVDGATLQIGLKQTSTGDSLVSPVIFSQWTDSTGTAYTSITALLSAFSDLGVLLAATSKVYEIDFMLDTQATTNWAYRLSAFATKEYGSDMGILKSADPDTATDAIYRDAAYFGLTSEAQTITGFKLQLGYLGLNVDNVALVAISMDADGFSNPVKTILLNTSTVAAGLNTYVPADFAVTEIPANKKICLFMSATSGLNISPCYLELTCSID